jgi:hypothetical protein
MNTQHRKASRAKRIRLPLVNPIEHAMASARCFTPAQLERLMAPNRAAVHALQFGGFSAEHWKVLADAFNVAEVLARPPVNIANDHADKFEEAQTVLYALSEQHRDRGTWTARSEQLLAVKAAMEIFQIQLENVGQGEFERAVEKLRQRMIQALRGNGGGVQLVTVPA